MASYIGETLTAGGTITEVDGNRVSIEVFIKNEAGDVIAPGVATAEINS